MKARTILTAFGLALLAMAVVLLQSVFLHALGLGGLMLAMAAVSTTNPTDFADRTQTYFNPKLLKALQFNLKLAGYGLSEGYKAIGTTIRFYRPRKANLSGINAEAARTTSLAITKLVTPTALTEGTKPTTLTEVKVGYIDISMYQQGGLATITDKLQAIDLLNTLQVYSRTMGEDAALDYDTVIRDSLISGVASSDAKYVNSTNDGGYFERFAGVPNTGNSATDYASLTGLSKANGKITRGVALGVVTQLASAKIPKIGGNYVAVTPPQVTHDIRQDETWVRAAVFAGDPLYKDLDLMLDGVAYVRANNPWVEGATYLTESATDPGDGLVYSTIFLGADAFGMPNLTNKRAGGSQSAPRIIVLDKEDKSDPLNQQTVIGWKSFFGSGPFICASRTNEIGDVPRYVVLRSKSTFI
jgi:N4-gp56 family major capsid protein